MTRIIDKEASFVGLQIINLYRRAYQLYYRYRLDRKLWDSGIGDRVVENLVKVKKLCKEAGLEATYFEKIENEVIEHEHIS